MRLVGGSRRAEGRPYVQYWPTRLRGSWRTQAASAPRLTPMGYLRRPGTPSRGCAARVYLKRPRDCLSRVLAIGLLSLGMSSTGWKYGRLTVGIASKELHTTISALTNNCKRTPLFGWTDADNEVDLSRNTLFHTVFSQEYQAAKYP